MPPHQHCDPAFVAHQYRTSVNLAARQRIYEYGTSHVKWHPWVFEQMTPLLPPAARVLELGCGNAALWRENLDRVPAGWDVILSDRSAGMLDDARRALGDRAARFQFARIDAQGIPLPDRALDAVVANHMLYHVPDRPRAYAEIARVLRPGGHLFAATNGDGHAMEIRKLIDQSVPLRERCGFSLRGFSLRSNSCTCAASCACRRLNPLSITSTRWNCRSRCRKSRWSASGARWRMRSTGSATFASPPRPGSAAP